ncbi:DUF2147 domain-containing protein [Sneathiella sp.]|uniref:DUF2147 domain-containing protein n=1 Tax=Sneathiella sp. TaxID=1964365 RepID=UPI0035667D8E
MRTCFLGIVGVTTAMLLSGSPARASDITGTWSTVDNKSHVKIEPCGEKLCGKVIWLKTPTGADGKPVIDKNNSDDALKSRPILGMELLTAFVPSGSNEWDGGKIYNPEDGKTYDASLSLEKPDQLNVKGCIAIFCKTKVWSKIQ